MSLDSLDQELQPIDWEKIENAVYDWLTGGIDGFNSIVPEAIWENQDIPQPAYPYASMKIIAHSKEGGRDEIRTSTDLAQPLGQEIEMLATDQNQITLAISFHTDISSDGMTPASRARALAGKARSSLGLPGVLAFLREAGLAVVAEEGITDTSLVVNSDWLSRATFDVRLRVASQMTERVGYIGKVELDSEDLEVNEIIESA